MGGGGVIRAVGKVAGIGAAATLGIRGAHPASLAEHAARGSSRNNVPAIVSSKGGDVSPVAVQKPAWEIDDWEFAEGDLMISSGEPMPRVVFGPAPSFEEAKVATDELKDALEKVYLSSPAIAETENSIPLGHPSELSDSVAESKHLVYAETAAASPASKHVVQAFKLLTQSSVAQNVVASIASDPNVWNAVLQNPALVGFIQNEKASAQLPSVHSNVSSVVGKVAAIDDGVSTESFDESSSDNKNEKLENRLMDILQSVKHAVEEMVSKVSGFFHNIFGPKPGEPMVGSEDGASTVTEKVVGASFMGLAIMAILVVLLKRV